MPWLEPIPDALFGTAPADPAAVVVSRTSMRLALTAALQYLPPRQRAVLILRDVLRWRAAEVAGLLGISTVAVNSLLQRARTQLELAAPAEDAIREPTRRAERELVGRYAAAFENADLAALVGLLRDDAVLEMPPLPGWFRGRDAIAAFLGAEVLVRPPGPGQPLPQVVQLTLRNVDPERPDRRRLVHSSASRRPVRQGVVHRLGHRQRTDVPPVVVERRS